VLKGGYRENQLVEMLLQRPQLIKHPQELEDGYVWQRLIMVRHAGVQHVCVLPLLLLGRSRAGLTSNWSLRPQART
jgi:hypothetical protein